MYMSKRRYKSHDEVDSIEELVVRLVVTLVLVGVMYLMFSFAVDREQFWYEIKNFVIPMVLALIGAGVLFSVYVVRKNNIRKAFVDTRLESIMNSPIEAQINSFIERFGKEGKGKGWQYRNYTFDWSRLKDFREELIKGGVLISVENLKDMVSLLRYFIDKKEKEYLVAGTVMSNKTTHSFSELNRAGSDLEELIVRLYDAMGYASKRIGGAGDQGGDVIASKNGENVLIQAKSYTVAVNNSSVQQAHTALAFHGCSRAVVITTSTFTSSAYELARANNVELFDGELLKRKLQEHLGEIWT